MSGSNSKLARKTMVLALFTIIVITIMGQLSNNTIGTTTVAASSMSRSYQDNASQDADKTLAEAKALNAKAIELYKKGQLDEAITFAKRALASFEKALGPDAPLVATVCKTLGSLYGYKRDFQNAEPLFKRALAIYEKALGPDDPHVASICDSLGGIYKDQRDYQSAEALFKRALTIYEKSLGPNDLSVADCCGSLGILCRLKGDYQNGELLFKRALTICEKALGPDDPTIATISGELGTLYRDKGDYQNAEAFYKRALTIFEKAFGPDDALVASSCDNLGLLYRLKGDYQNAEPFLKRALAINEKVLGPDRAAVANSCSNLASLYQDKGDFQNAEALFKRALAILEKALGPDDLNVAAGCSNLGTLYQDKGDFQSAEALFKRSLAIYQKVLGPDHLAVATSYNNLGFFYENKGDFQSAERLLKRALAIKEKALGPDHPDVAGCCSNLANLYQDKGDFQSAEPLLKRALAIYEKAFGPDHPNIANNCNDLGILYRLKGDLQSAEPLLKRALAINEKVRGADHPAVANNCNNLGLLYYDKGDFQNAESFYKRSLAINEKAFGPDHPAVGTNYNNLGLLYQNKGDLQSAEPLLKRALAINEKALGADHPDVANNCNSLGTLYLRKGDLQSAEQLLKRAMTIYEKTLGPDQPDVAIPCGNLGDLYEIKGDIKQAIFYNNKSNEIREKEFQHNLGAGSEKQKLLYLNKTALDQDSTISLNLQTAPTQLSAAESALTVILRRKGRALDAMTNAIANLRARANKEDIELLDQLAAARASLSSATLKGPNKGPDKEGIEKYQAQLKTIEQQVEELENSVSTRSREFKVENSEITLQAIEQAIPDNARLIEFISYRPYDVKLSINHRYGKLRYAVYTLAHNGTLKWTDLGDAAIIDKACADFREVLIKQHDKPLSNIETELKPKARALDKLIMQPVRQLIGNSKRLLVSPDSNLNLIPFDALVDEKGKYLVESYEISYLTSGRDLLRLQNGITSEQKPIVMADPNYGDIKGPGTKMGEFVVSGARLSNTVNEANQIKRTLNLQTDEILLQDKASKAALKQLHRPEILHIATHGFFLKAQTGSAESRRTKIISASSPAESEKTVTDADVQEFKLNNPLLKSGLLFAGVNDGKGDDGVLTALEATGLDLWGTKLVVLSACDTGVGEIKNGDGVYGLRRALVLAGSESQLMSLWPVSDAGTRDLMIDYYRALKNNEGRSAGLRRVRLELLKDAKRAHPYYWASFIQSGEWANLAGKR